MEKYEHCASYVFLHSSASDWRTIPVNPPQSSDNNPNSWELVEMMGAGSGGYMGVIVHWRRRIPT